VGDKRGDKKRKEGRNSVNGTEREKEREENRKKKKRGGSGNASIVSAEPSSTSRSFGKNGYVLRKNLRENDRAEEKGRK